MAKSSFFTAVITCPGREESLASTLRHLDSSDWKFPVSVFCDTSANPCKKTRQTDNSRIALEKAILSEETFILFLEDDVRACNNLYYNISRWKPFRNCNHMSPFFSSLYNPGISVESWLPHGDGFIARTGHVYGSQALLMSRVTAKHILTKWYSIDGMQDIKMSRLASELSPVLYHAPSLFQHTQVASTWGGVYHYAADFSSRWRTDWTVNQSDLCESIQRQPIMERMSGTYGWLSDGEADLLITATAEAWGRFPGMPMVEIGPYLGKSTVTIGITLSQIGCENKALLSFDRHDGAIDWADGKKLTTPQTKDHYLFNIKFSGIDHIVDPIMMLPRSWQSECQASMVFLDGPHDYEGMMADFAPFSRKMPVGGIVACHDNAYYFPGVQRFVQELARSNYRVAGESGSLVLLEKEN